MIYLKEAEVLEKTKDKKEDEKIFTLSELKFFLSVEAVDVLLRAYDEAGESEIIALNVVDELKTIWLEIRKRIGHYKL